MGWAVGRDRARRRHIGYGVPALCDHPGCFEKIDRGLSYACGGGVVGIYDANCGLFFCKHHLLYRAVCNGELCTPESLSAAQLEDVRVEFVEVCERCAMGMAPFDPRPDTAEWAWHVTHDSSWRAWREDEPEWAAEMQKIVDKAVQNHDNKPDFRPEDMDEHQVWVWLAGATPPHWAIKGTGVVVP